MGEDGRGRVRMPAGSSVEWAAAPPECPTHASHFIRRCAHTVVVQIAKYTILIRLRPFSASASSGDWYRYGAPASGDNDDDASGDDNEMMLPLRLLVVMMVVVMPACVSSEMSVTPVPTPFPPANECYTKEDCQNYPCNSTDGATGHGGLYINPSDIIAWLGRPDQDAMVKFQANMMTAANIIASHEGFISHLESFEMHTTLKYFCCYNVTTLDRIAQVLHGYQFPTFNVTFDRISCNRFYPNNAVLDFFALLDNKTNTEMQLWIADLEARITEAGIPVHKPRKYQTPFHSTLATVNASTYPVQEVLAEIASAIPVLTPIPMSVDWFFMDIPLGIFSNKNTSERGA